MQKIKTKNNKGKQPEDLTLKYPVKKIIVCVKNLSVRQVAKKFGLTHPTIRKIIDRYGSKELKDKTKSRSLHKRAEEIKEKKGNEAVEVYNNSELLITDLMLPSINLTESASRIKEIGVKLSDIFVNGFMTMESINKKLSSIKEWNEEGVAEIKESIQEFINIDVLKLARVTFDAWEKFGSMSEKFAKIEVVSKDLATIKYLIDIMFQKLNLLDESTYKQYRESVINQVPFSRQLFLKFEEDAISKGYSADRTGEEAGGKEETGNANADN